MRSYTELAVQPCQGRTAEDYLLSCLRTSTSFEDTQTRKPAIKQQQCESPCYGCQYTYHSKQHSQSQMLFSQMLKLWHLSHCILKQTWKHWNINTDTRAILIVRWRSHLRGPPIEQFGANSCILRQKSLSEK